jgi:hypothetical protein
MDKRHFDQLVKGVREMKRHMAGKSVRGARTTEPPAPDVRTIREAAHISQSQVREIDWREPAHSAKLGTAPHAAHRTRPGAAQDRCFKPLRHCTDKARLSSIGRSRLLESHSRLGFPGDGRAEDTWSDSFMS